MGVHARSGDRLTEVKRSRFFAHTMSHPPRFPASKDQAGAYARAVFESVDRMDAQAFGAWFSPRGSFVFGNAAPCVGPQEVAREVGRFFSAIRALRHELHECWYCDGALVCRLGATYTRHDGSQLTLPAATIWRGGEAGIDDYRIYADLTPLFAPG